MATLRKGDLVASIADKAKVSRADAEASLNAVVDTLRDALSRGDRVVLTGFGTFEVREVRARQVKAIRGGGTITVPGHKRVGFSAGAFLARAVGRRR